MTMAPERRERELALAELDEVEISPEELRRWAATGECPDPLR